jgi:8-oxo-dGTP diphosphatase
MHNWKKYMPSRLPAPITAVSVAVLSDGGFLLVRRARPPAEGMFAFPGGRIEPGESTRDAAMRELLEETGLTVDELEPFDEIEIGTADRLFALTVLVGRGVSGTILPGDDAAEAGWFSLEEMADLPVTDSTFAIARRIAQQASREA